VKPAGVVNSFKKEFENNIEIHTSEHGKGKKKTVRVWITVKNKDFKKAVRHLFKLQEFPHFSVSSGTDLGKEIEIINHFVLNYGERLKAIPVSIKVKLPKRKPEMETITDLFPSAIISEQEKMEMLGITIKGIPRNRVFTDESMPSNAFPWRKDSKGVEKIARNLHEEKRGNKK